MNASSSSNHLVENFFREQWRNTIASLTSRYGPRHLDDIENAVQTAMARALDRWAYSGIPENPNGWIYQSACNAFLDELRKKQTRERLADAVAESQSQTEPCKDVSQEDPLNDDVLRMILLCSNPQIKSRDSLVLTLRIVCGLGFGEIAAGLCMDKEAVRKSLTRCKRTLAQLDGLLDEPGSTAREDRLSSVLRTVYLLFNEGYFASHGNSLTRRDLCQEAERLMALLRKSSLSSDNRIWALSALFAFQSSRFDARTAANGEVILLSQQHRSKWNETVIAQGMMYFRRSLRSFESSRYHLEAAIAACHVASSSYEETDWDRIVGYYDALLEMTGLPVVRMNRAVAVMELEGPDAALEELQQLETRRDMVHNRLLSSLLAECHRRRGDAVAARIYYEKSIKQSSNQALAEFWAAQGFDQLNP